MNTNGTTGTEEDVPALEIPARLPPGVPAPGTLLGEDPPPPVARAFRELRFALERARERNGIRSLGIVSADEKDGRSVTAVHLALALVAGGRRKVAVVDASFGTGTIATLLGSETPAGLAEVLAGRLPLDAALLATSRPGLFALPAGDAVQSRIEPLDALETFEAVTARLASVFDYVLVDTPALSSGVDAVALASRLDGVVVVVRARRTRAADLRRLLARFGDTKVLGLVLNDARS